MCVAARLLHGWARWSSDVVTGKQLAAFDPQHDNVSGVRLIPTGSIADQIVVRDGDDIVRLTFGTRPAKVDNIGRLPMAWVDPAAGRQPHGAWQAEPRRWRNTNVRWMSGACCRRRRWSASSRRR